MKTTAQLTLEKVRFDQPTDAHLVVTLAAPPTDAVKARSPVCVIPVLDVSGSMAGAKLHYARQSILKLVDHLGPEDLCGVVVFSTEVETLAAPERMTPERKDALKAAVGRLGPGSNTNLGGGMLGGLDHARVTRLPPGMLVRVILFTDGLANAGPATSREQLLRLLETNLGEATLSAFGYGDDADQELLRDLSTLGKGNYAYVRSPEDALTAFARELGGLLSTAAQRIEARITPAAGVDVTDVVSDVDAREERGTVVVHVPELLADEVRHVVLGVRLWPRPAALDAPVTAAEVEVAFERFEAGRVVRERRSCKALVRFVDAGEAQAAPTHGLDEVVAVAQLVRAQIDAEEAASQGRFDEARDGMALFQQAVLHRGHASVAAAAGKLVDRLGNEDAYRGSRSYRASLRKGSTRNVSSAYEAEAEADLRAMKQATRTAAQERMEEAFGAPGPRSRRTSGAPPRREPSRQVERRRSRRW